MWDFRNVKTETEHIPDSPVQATYVGDVLVGLLGSTDLVSLRVHVDLGFALLVHLFVFQLRDKSHEEYFTFPSELPGPLSVKPVCGGGVGLTVLVMSLTFFMCCWYGVS